jgi:type II secretory pathway component PulJ
MTPLEEVSVEQMISRIRNSIEQTLAQGYEGNAEALTSQLIAFCKQHMPEHVTVKSAGVVASFSLRKNGQIDFFNHEGAFVSWQRQPKMKSRRLRRRWARKQVGKLLADLWVKPVEPINVLTVQFTVASETT